MIGTVMHGTENNAQPAVSDATREVRHGTRARKATYAVPVLTTYGEVTTLTMGSSGQKADPGTTRGRP